MKLKNVIICISLLIILLNISCVFAAQDIDTNNSLTASDTTINEVSTNGELQGNVVSGESDLSNKLGSANDENVLSENNSSGSRLKANIDSDAESSNDALASSVNSSLGAKNTISTQLVAPNRIIYVNDAAGGYDYQIILKDKDGKRLSNKQVSVYFNGKTISATTSSSGWAQVKLTANAEGIYNVKVTFAGDDTYGAISQVATIKLLKEQTKFIAPTRIYYVSDLAKGYDFPAVLKNKDNKVLANKKILFSVNGVKQIAMTGNNGYVYFPLKLNTAGVYNIELKFAGDRYYNGVTEYRSIKLIKELAVLSAETKVLDLPDISSGYKYNVYLKDKYGKALADKKILVIFKGKKIIATTNNKGLATFNLVSYRAGIHDMEIRFAGDRYFDGVTIHRTMTILDTGNPYGNKAKKVWINSDSGSGDMKNAVANLLRKYGWTVYVGKTDSNAHYTDYFKVTSDYQAYITLYNGFCAGTIREAYSSSIQNTLKKKGVTLVVMWDTRDWTNPDGMGPYRYGDFSGYNAKRAWDDNFSIGDPSINDVAGYLKSNNAKYCAYPTAQGLVAQFLGGGYFAMNS